MIRDFSKARGELTIVLTDENGQIKEQWTRNLIVAAGLAHMTNRMVGTASAVMSHMGIGSGTVAAAGGDTALGSQLGRVALASTTRVTTTVANDAVQYVATFGAGAGTGAVTEAGLFNAASAGEMLARTVFAVVNKGALDSLSITWKVTFS